MKICTIPGHVPIAGASILTRTLWAPGQTITVENVNVPARIWPSVVAGANEWTKHANLNFQFLSHGRGQIRVGWEYGGGSWSMLGVDCLTVGAGLSMCFGWEERSTFIHEFGHAIGLNHSQNAKNFPYRFKEDVVIKYFSGPPNNWPIEVIRSNILNRVKGNVIENPWTQKDVMQYYFPKEMIVEGVDLEPGSEISPEEIALVKQIYPGR